MVAGWITDEFRTVIKGEPITFGHLSANHKTVFTQAQCIAYVLHRTLLKCISQLNQMIFKYHSALVEEELSG